MLKCGNQRVFKRDLEHHLADLTHTKGEPYHTHTHTHKHTHTHTHTQPFAIFVTSTDEIKSEGFDNVDGLDNAQLYLGVSTRTQSVSLQLYL